MKQVYVIAASVVAAVGGWSVVGDVFSRDEFFHGIGAMIGFGIALLGVLNLLNYAYGAAARGLRFVAVAGNFVMLLILWPFAPPSNPLGWVLVTLLAVMTLLAALRRSLRASASPTQLAGSP